MFPPLFFFRLVEMMKLTDGASRLNQFLGYVDTVDKWKLMHRMSFVSSPFPSWVVADA